MSSLVQYSTVPYSVPRVKPSIAVHCSVLQFVSEQYFEVYYTVKAAENIAIQKPACSKISRSKKS